MHDTVVVRRTIQAVPARVWAVLADGWLYPSWVVGASRMRDVEESWPAPGSQLHHSVGLWPLLLDDRTELWLLHVAVALVLATFWRTVVGRGPLEAATTWVSFRVAAATVRR